MTERGQGLITRILKTTEPEKLDRPVHRLNRAALKSKSDHEYAYVLDRLASRPKEELTEQGRDELRKAIRVLTKRGLLRRITEAEDE